MLKIFIISITFAIIAGGNLFIFKYKVQTQEQRLSELKRNIAEAQESIHVLKAEWDYLNNPSRLRVQAERHLGLHSLKLNQITTIASIPMKESHIGNISPSNKSIEKISSIPLVKKTSKITFTLKQTQKIATTVTNSTLDKM
jgi:hypothetical protein